MPGHIPKLDDQSLRRLRALVGRLHEHEAASLPLGDLVQLARDVQLDAGVTVDFQASQQLGTPMIVLRVPDAVLPANLADRLSPREREIAGLIAQGLANKNIARRLKLTLGTVKDHVHRILKKTELPNRAAIAAACARGA